MESSVPVEQWPAVRDVVRRLDLCQPTVCRLIHAGKLQAKRTRLGYLVDPASVDAYATERERRLPRKRAA